MTKVSTPRLLIAAGVALVADVLQWLLIPLGSFAGIADPANDILDLCVASIMVALLGWHWAFLPSAIGKLVPFVDMVPFWSAAVFIVGMGREGGPNPHSPGQPGQPIFFPPGMIPPGPGNQTMPPMITIPGAQIIQHPPQQLHEGPGQPPR